MTWLTKAKDLGISSTQGHTILQPGLLDRAPAITAINFTPLELYGAMARCHYTHLLNPHAVSWEVKHMASLLEQHVDDTSHPFDLLASADTMKDFVQTYFIGTVAAGIAYLVMINDGYVWSDHWENLVPKPPGRTRKAPDFVFASPMHGTALMESKGTRSAMASAFNTTVSDGYDHQVEPHLGRAIGGSTATHGYAIGSHLVSTTQASLNIHHTRVPASVGGGGAAAGSPTSIQRHSYATAFSLAHGPDLGRQIRTGEAREPQGFVRYWWAGRSWVSSARPGPVREILRDVGQTWFSGGPEPEQPVSFAIQEDRAVAALRRFLPPAREADARVYRIPFDEAGDSLGFKRGIERIAAERGEGAEGAIFPDGFAVIGALREPPAELVFWDGYEGVFRPLVDGWRDRF